MTFKDKTKSTNLQVEYEMTEKLKTFSNLTIIFKKLFAYPVAFCVGGQRLVTLK